MKKYLLQGIVVLAILGIAVSAQAVRILSFSLIGSGQTVSPTDNVLVQGRVTNTGIP